MASNGSKKPLPDIDNNRLSVESKESSYMGFDRGIDSDIEIEPGCRSVDAQANSSDPLTAGRCSSEPHLKRRIVLTPKLARWESLDPPESGDSQTLVPPDSKVNDIGKSNSLMQLKKIDLENGIDNTNQKISMPLNDLKTILPNHRSPVGGNSGLSPLQVPATISVPPPNNAGSSFNSLGTHSVGRSRYEASNKKYTSDSLMNMLSGIYAKLLIVMGICFPVAEVMSKKIPTSYYEGFYLYLYGLSIGYLFFMYCFILRSEKQHKQVSCKEKFLLCFRSVHKHDNSIEQSDDCSSSHHSSSRSINQSNKLNRLYESYEYTYCYLRLGVVAFGIASMIYSGLEFGQFFELQPGSSCYNVLFGISPIARMSFTFIQMYFIFLNSQICIKRYKIVARFGLMHLIATNICIWLHVLVQETKHGILNLMNVNFTLPVASSIPLNVLAGVTNDINFTELIFEVPVNLSRVDRSIPDQVPQTILECRRSNIMGELVQEASHFLFPCTIQYSLICAAILYIMWKNIGKFGQIKLSNDVATNNTSFSTIQRQYSDVDCTKANKGLFTGILVLVLSIISIILFYVLISKPNYRGLAITEARVTELGLYLLTSVAVSVALIQVRELKYSSSKDTELDQILLIVAQSGLYLFTMFSIIGGHFTADQNTLLVLLTSSACIIQATLQTIFILDASNCYASTADQLRRKPGRELVTFLLVCNFAMWVMNTLQTQRPDSNPIQLEFYGLWTWTVITHITTPLAIYFRFHSTVCLCAIWKKTYKLKSDFV